MADPPLGGPAPPTEPDHATQPPPASKKLFSIFAPRSAASGSTTPSAAAAPAESSTGSVPPGKAAAARAASVSAQSATGTETLSLVEDSGESDGGAAAGARGRATKGKGKGKEVVRGKGKKAREAEEEEEEHEDEDDEVVVVGGSSTTAAKKGKGKATAMQATKAKGKGKKRAPSPVASDSDDAASSAPSTPRTPAKRRSTTRRAAAAAPTQDDAVVDLTRSPPRKKKKKKAGKDNEADAVVVGTAGHAFSDERRAARDRAKKREAPEARWPTREEHEGGEGALVALGGGGSARGAWNARWPHMGGKGKERAVDEDPGAGAGSNFLEDMRRALFDPLQPSSSGAAPPTPTFSRRAHSSAPNLLPPFAPHPLLDRLAAPFRSPSSFPSAFARPTDPARVPSEDDAKLWSVKYSPQSADEVLGEVSGQSALWLREWLEELKVQSAAGDADAARRRRPVARGSLKKKKKAKRRKPLDDFIASSDGDDDDLVGGVPSSSYDALGSGFSDDNEDDDLLLPSGSASSRRAGSVFPTLTNLILLHGPHGTGKSAAVHAVARELEYEVFEVFPGMGRRGAKDLERYVGDVGRNHVVLGGSPRKGGNVAAMFQRMQAKAETGASGAKGTEKAVNGGADDARKAGDTDKGPTQSLILVDEVDVLFKGEEDFWQGLIALAQQSRRPIVMTCTDPSLVPFDDLGLQQVVFSPSAPPVNFLSFAAPSPDLAVPYLQLVALREGHILSASTVASLYSRFSPSRPYPAWLTQQQPGERPLPHPLSSMPLPSDDLRKALMQLQFECGWGLPGRAEPAGSHGAPGEPETMWCEGALRVPPDAEDVDVPVAATSASSGTPSLTKNGASVGVDALERATQAADALSFADAHVSRRIAVLLEDEETGRFTTAADAEESFPVLSFSVREETQRLPFIGAEPDMARAIEQLATRLWGDAARFGAREDEELESKRSELTFRLAQLVHSGGERALLQPPFDPVLPNAAVTTDYRPYLRAITLADDARLAASALATASATDEGGPSEVHAYGMAAALAAGAGPGGARKTRKSARQKAQQGKPMYERVLGWESEVEAGWLRASGFEVPGQ